MATAVARSLRVVLVTPYFRSPREPDSGIGNHFYDLAWALAEFGQAVTVLHITRTAAPTTDMATATGKFRLVQLAVQPPAWLGRLGRRGWIFDQLWFEIGRIAACRRWFRRLPVAERPDVIETTSFGALCLGLAFSRHGPPMAVRVSTTLDQIIGDYFPLSSRLLRSLGRLESILIRRSPHLVTHTLAHRDQICAALRLPPARFSLIPHGIELPADAALPPPNASPERINVLYVGRFEFRKGTDVLLDALPRVLAAAPGVQVELVGRDPAHEFDKRFLERDGAPFAARVKCLGSVDRSELHTRYRACDIFVAPSRYESFGLIYVEAMAWGKPVIGCRTGGVPEVVRDGATGLLAVAGDVSDLAEKLLTLARDPALRARLGAAARREAVMRFSREAMAAQSIALYHRLLETHRGR